MFHRQISFLLLLISICPILSRSIQSDSFVDTSEDQDFDRYSVVSNKDLKVKNNDDSQKLVSLGQISGLASNTQNPNLLFIFHRGAIQWNQKSFPDGIHYDQKKFGPIEENTILLVDTRTGLLVNQWANRTFSMPHGLSMDNQGNLWLTDVAMHQVFKYSDGEIKMKLGEEFVPGNDEKHFCKPTDVVVSNDGSNIFVADGYCNSRLVKFDSKGNFLRQYSMKQNEKQLLIPHSLVLIETLDLICVADRENGRIVCFDSGLDDQQTGENDDGKIKIILDHPEIKTIYAITYDPIKYRLYAVSGGSGNDRAMGFTFDARPESFGQLISTWKPNHNFGEPHDLALSVDGRSLFVGEIHPNRIDTFDVIN